jgi:hypothetical protein
VKFKPGIAAVTDPITIFSDDVVVRFRDVGCVS